MNDPISFNKFLMETFDLKKEPVFDGVLDSIPMTPKNRKIYFNQSDLEFISSFIN